MFSTTAAAAPPFEAYRDRHLAELRDRYAGLAMQAFIAKAPSNVGEEQIAYAAWTMADAMVKERENDGR